ncbi:MAG: restriction endonuclease subunit S, partial [Gammaproteobacteria bacterium SHHR-1]
MSYQRLPFEEVLTDESGGNIKTPQSEYLLTGPFPVVDQGKELIAGYVDDPNRICGGGKSAIVFGDHTRCIKYVDF